MNWVMLLRPQDHRLHSKSWFSGKSSSSPAPISEKLKKYGKGKKPVKGYERMLALAAHALAEGHSKPEQKICGTSHLFLLLLGNLVRTNAAGNPMRDRMDI